MFLLSKAEVETKLQEMKRQEEYQNQVEETPEPTEKDGDENTGTVEKLVEQGQDADNTDRTITSPSQVGGTEVPGSKVSETAKLVGDADSNITGPGTTKKWGMFEYSLL